MALDVYAIVSGGYINEDGVVPEPFTIATDGYIIDVEKVGPGDFKIFPRKKKKKPQPGGIGEPPEPYDGLSVDEEDEEVMAIIRIFLEYESQGLFD